MPKIHSIETNSDNMITPASPVDINGVVFEANDDKTLTNNALLCHDILRYGREQRYNSNGFRFTDLVNWLMRNNLEFIKYYSGYKTKTPYNLRLANNRQRIQKLVDRLITLGLIKIKSLTTAEKNKREPIELYDLTIEGRFLSWLIKARDEYISKEKSFKTIQRILELVDKCIEISDSYTLLFVNTFFKKCMQTGGFDFIVDFFMSSILPWYTIRSGRELLLLFLGIRSPLNWIIANHEVFIETLMELNAEARAIMLFQFKKEIEEYHNLNYLREELEAREFNERLSLESKKNDLRMNQLGSPRFSVNKDISSNEEVSDIIRIPGKEWQETQFYNIDNYSNVSIPGYCDICREHRSFIVDIYSYLACILYTYFPHTDSSVSGQCTICSNGIISARVMRFDHFISAWR
jgi:hypothetical protein